MCQYFCTGFIDFMFASKTLIGYSLFSPCDFEKNDNIIFSYFKNEQMQFHWKDKFKNENLKWNQ